MVKVSTITSCFRGEKYLEGFLNHLPHQTMFDDIEIVFNHNEPSELETSLVEEYKSKYKNLNYTIEDEVIPLYAAWNKCISKSTSECICIWNIDDLRTPNSIEVMSKALDENPDVDFVYGSYLIVNSFGSNAGYLINEMGRENELTTGMILGPFFMFRRSILDKCGMFDEQFKSGGDFDFAMRLARSGKGLCLPDILGFYLNEGVGLSTNNDGLQQIERTVVELRYGLNVLEPQFIKEARKYDSTR
ncbi:MAG: glycosyltransferase [Proteobacteria bacterium]|nr:glycosyltransferase [Pseudomonadota bacterium]